MKNSQISKTKIFFYSFVFLSLFGLLSSPSLQQKNSVTATTGKAQFLSYVRDAFSDMQMSILSSNSSQTDVSLAVDSMSNFMESRSSIKMNPLIRQQLVQAEMICLKNPQKLISFDKLVDSITDTGLEQVSKLTDSQVEAMVSAAQGFDSPDLPLPIKQDRNSSLSSISIVPGYYTFMRKEDAITQVKTLRDSKVQFFARSSIRSFVKKEVKANLVDLTMALPERFGSNWDINKDIPNRNLTPTQCMLLTYSLASGDFLARNSSTLHQEMNKLYLAGTKMYGYYPHPSNHSPYGHNGYLHSSPTDQLFTENAQISLLNKLTTN